MRQTIYVFWVICFLLTPQKILHDNIPQELLEPSPGKPVYVDNIFDHFDDPPTENSIRLICIGYADSVDSDDVIEVVMVDNQAEVSKILNIIDNAMLSDNDDAIAMDYEINIQVIRGGVHQHYSIIFDEYDSRCELTKSRDENWYEISEENFQMLMSYFQ